jgi:glucose-1-phosphate cytidylyltransferase
MKVVILAGGFGTRIREVANDIPKPMIPIGAYPILWHIMKIYAGYGHNDFVVCLGYRGDAVKQFFLNYEAYTRDVTVSFGVEGRVTFHNDLQEAGWTVTLADTGPRTMTGGRISRARRYAGGEDFFLTYGDGVSDIDIDALLRFHRAHGRILTVTGVRPPGRFGELARDDSGLVTEFNEKPQATGGRISGGFFVAKPELFDYLADDEGLVFEEEPMRQLVRDRELMMYEHDGFWQPMDTSRDYKFLNELLDRGEAPWVR